MAEKIHVGLEKASRKEIEQVRKAFKDLEADVIDGAAPLGPNGRLHFRIRFKNSPKPDLIYSKVANVLYPQLVIQFYEKCLRERSSNPVASGRASAATASPSSKQEDQPSASSKSVNGTSTADQ